MLLRSRSVEQHVAQRIGVVYRGQPFARSVLGWSAGFGWTRAQRCEIMTGQNYTGRLGWEFAGLERRTGGRNEDIADG